MTMAYGEDRLEPASKSWNDVPWGWIYCFLFLFIWLVGWPFEISIISQKGIVFAALSLCILVWRANRAYIKEDEKAALEKLKQEKRDKSRAARRADKARGDAANARMRAERASIKAEKARREKEAFEKAQKPKLSALEAAKLAISLVETMSLEELRPVIEILKKSNEIVEVLKNANDELIGHYSEKIEAIYASRGILPSEPFYDTQLKTDLERCMSLGMNSIEKKLELEDISVSVPSTVSGKKIEKTRKWKDIQRDLK